VLLSQGTWLRHFDVSGERSTTPETSLRERHTGDIAERLPTGARSRPYNPTVFDHTPFPYPPKPAEELLSEENISTWANAPETGGDLPFYPPKENGEYVLTW